ncbi:uncharacterized protein LOC110376582 [Helicoverpa armigera]|uniref:Uncharacterized protein n=1 Tax=Helicoverpa armigera TaxID=29058 RepID=A0A2W1BRB5_HELAM|nr:uncharacterized protein LOC110376582 [Helicoverpa armigera]PZC77642.1 hypothetical protein B5X24_HaOG203086 [Helicoverpa armigera]
MLFLMVVIILSNIAYVSNKNAGTTLFDYAKTSANCWTQDDIAKLKARKTFEELIPPQVSPDRVDSRYIREILKYFRSAFRNVQRDVDFKTASILKEALSDTVGAHLKSEILPTVRFAYYAGYVPYRHAKQVHDFYELIKTNMNTQGLGWRPPERIPQWSNLTVAKILIGSGKLLDPCSCLVTRRDSSNCIHLPAPKLDDERHPSAIALPFRSEGLVSLTAPSSENILLKYYTTASRCILHSSPAHCRHADFVNLNNELWHWMKREVAPHLVDEKLYTAYGGVLRIAAAVQNYGKGLSRRNLFEYQTAAVSKFSPWKSLTQSYIYINADWTPKLYVTLVLLTAAAICLLQMCYNYMFGDHGCSCKNRSARTNYSRDCAYTKVDSNFPAVLPHQSAIYYSDQKRVKRPPTKSKTSSLGSIKTQRVYDLNENTEKLMAIIMSEDSEGGSSPSKIDSGDDCGDRRIAIADVTKDNRPRSPPKIETSLAQLTIEKTLPSSDKKSSIPMYSTSTLTRSELTYCPDKLLSDTCWSATSTSTSGKSISSTSSKSRSGRSRSSRDLAWARHVISRHSRRGPMQSTTGTELDANSFITPPSRR